MTESLEREMTEGLGRVQLGGALTVPDTCWPAWGGRGAPENNAHPSDRPTRHVQVTAQYWGFGGRIFLGKPINFGNTRRRARGNGRFSRSFRDFSSDSPRVFTIF